MESIAQGISAASEAAVGVGLADEATLAGNFTAELLAGLYENQEAAVFAPTELLLYVINTLFSAVKENSAEIVSLAATCVIGVFLAGLAKQNGLLSGSAGRAGIAAATALPAGAVFAAAFGSAKAAMSALESAGLAVIPAVAVAGKGAGAYGFVACAQAMSMLLRYLFLPLVAIYAALSYTAAVSGEGMLGGAKASVKKLFTWGLGFVMTVFSFCSVSSGLATNASATLGFRTVKYAGSMIPFVGSYLTEAADTVLASAALIRTAGGVCAVMVVVFTVLTPFVKIAAYYCAMSLLSALAGAFTGGSTASVASKELLDVTAELTGMLVGLLALMAAFFIINIAVLAR